MTTNKPEVVARLLTWAGPRHEPVPWEGVCARTFAEFPLENPFHGHWKEGEPLIRLSDYEKLAAKCEKLRKDAEVMSQLLRECRAHLKPYHDSFMKAEAWEEGRYKPADALYRKIDAAMEGAASEGS